MIKPTIVIGAYEASKEQVKEILAGIEEEGVICEVFHSAIKKEAITLAGEARNRSILNTGIGIDKSCAKLMVAGVNREALMTTTSQWRKLGQNAARYVKGNAFKE